MQINTLAQLYDYFDQLAQQDGSDDDLFASSYIRGFIALVASNFGDESQLLSTQLAVSVTEQLKQGKSELTPQDQQIVKQYWEALSQKFTY